MKFFQVDKQKLTPDEIKEYIKRFQVEMLPDIERKEKYYMGDNPYVAQRSNDSTSGAPDWRVRVSYARKIVNTVAGYMFKPGNIKYILDKNQDALNNIFTINKEVIKSSQIGKIISAQGVGYELFMADESGNPIWVIADNKEIIPFYTNDLNSKLFCFIRYIELEEENEPVYMVDVYYADVIEHYRFKKNRVEKIAKDTKNIYAKSGMPPLNVIKNNDEMIGDYETVIWNGKNAGLIDAYDVIYSDGMNEEDRFAWAYLLLSDQLSKEDADKIKSTRAFQNLGNEGFVKFLTKDIPTDFFAHMQKSIKSEIHQQTHVPDFLDMTIGNEMSGVALDRLLYDFEFICTAKETYFKDGLINRIRMLDALTNLTDSEMVSQDVTIIMERNKPIDSQTNAEVATKYKQSGLPILDKTLVENFAPFVKDVDKEIEEYDKQEEENFNNNIDNEIMNFGGFNGQGIDDPTATGKVQESASRAT
jgi:SPP1 family phage portal protein